MEWTVTKTNNNTYALEQRVEIDVSTEEFSLLKSIAKQQPVNAKYPEQGLAAHPKFYDLESKGFIQTTKKSTPPAPQYEISPTGNIALKLITDYK